MWGWAGCWSSALPKRHILKSCRLQENQSSRLAQDVDEKCRLIENLQEAVRKCKEFEVSPRTQNRWLWFWRKRFRHMHDL